MYRLLKAGGGGGGGFWQPRPGKQIIFLPLTLSVSLTLYALIKSRGTYGKVLYTLYGTK